MVSKIKYFLIGSLLLMVIGSLLTSKPETKTDDMMTQSESGFLIQEANFIASGAVIYWRKPIAMGGGKKSFLNIKDVSVFGVEPVNAIRIHRISDVTKESFRLTSIGIMTGVKVISLISGNGLVGTPVVEHPADQ